MDESERLQRMNENRYNEERDLLDDKLASRICELLNDPKIDKYCMVDAYYYDFSVIPEKVQGKFNLCRDAYLIFGINTDGDIITKWVDRWDLDSNDPIVNGKVIHPEYKEGSYVYEIPRIEQTFDPNLLKCPTFTIFSKSD